MTYTAEEGRQQILDALALAAQEVGIALAELSEAYEHLDNHAAERLEETLFQPVQAAYGRAKSLHTAFAERCGLPRRTFDAAPQVAPSATPKGSIERAVERAAKADATLAELQDSMLPVEVGDEPLRSGLAGIRQLLADLRTRGREIVRTLGR
ncbi:MAG: hypothetical protein ACTHM1_09850 [Solirubrobacteraceae bacterium]